MTVEVWATIGTTASANDDVYTTLAISATKATDGGSANKTAVTGQVITIKNGSLAVAVASDTPLASILVGDNTAQLISKFTFASSYEAFTVNEMRVSATTSPGVTADNYTGVFLKYVDADGVTIITSAIPLVNGTSTFAEQTMHVPANDTADLEVYGNLNYVGSGYAGTGDRPQLELRYAKANSNSSSTYVLATTIPSFGEQMVLYKTAPIVAISGTSVGTLVNGQNSLYAFTVNANAKGNVGIKKVTFNVSPSMGDADTIGNFKFYRGGTDMTDLVTITEGAGSTNLESTGTLASTTNATSVVVVIASEEVITKDTTQTYYLKANVTGVSTVGESISTYILDDASYADPSAYVTASTTKNFIWTDRSELSHSQITNDWFNGYLVNTLDSTTHTLSK